jgi:hypothetical protein
MRREDISRWAYAVCIVLILGGVLAVGWMVFDNKARCEEDGGVYVQTLFGYTCIPRRP